MSRDGAIVVVRPDQYVSGIFPLSARDEIADYFARLLHARRHGERNRISAEG